MPIDCIPTRLLERGRALGDAPGYATRVAGQWQMTSWASYVADARAAAKSLIALGFAADAERVPKLCILGFNRPSWVIGAHGAMLAGGAVAGIYTTCSSPEVQYIVEHAEAELVLVENASQLAKLVHEKSRLPNVKRVILFDGAESTDPWVLTWRAFLEAGKGVPDAELDARLGLITADRLASLIYTSGTTGPPKAVMLTHHNLAWTTSQARELIDMGPDERLLSYLPLSHIAEQIFTLHGPATFGYTVYFAESMERLRDDLVEVQPTILFGVPRVWEKFHAGIKAKLAEASPVRKRLAAWAMGVGHDVAMLRNEGKEPGAWLSLQYALANRLVFSRVKAALGLSKIKAAVSGAAPIGADVLHGLAGFDLVIREVYGQSEDTGPTTFNGPGRTRLGTVGPPYPGVEVKIADDGEILVRGPNVFAGYYKDARATAEVLVDGWMHSGDLGAFDADGYLSITGRKKEIIITAGGKNIAPKNIEAELKTFAPIAEAIVVGDRRRFLCALLVLDPAAVTAWGAQNGVADATPASPAVKAAIQAHVDAVNEKFAKVEWVREWRVLPRPLTIDDGELTPTLKIKRKKVEEHFAAILDEIYAEPDAG